MDAEKYARWIVQNQDKQGTPEFETVAQAYKAARAQQQTPAPTYDPTEGMSGTDKFLAGVGKAMTDVGRGVRQYLPESIGGLSNEQIQEARTLDQPLMNTGAGMAGNIVGNVAMAAPTALIPGAATIPGAAAIGAVSGALQPGVDAGERLKNIGIGGVAGAAVPTAIRAAQVGKSFVDPLYEGGRQKIIGRTIDRASGGQGQEVIKALRSAKELVPGSMPTAAEAAQNPGVAALQRSATAADTVAMNQLAARQVANNEARIAALRQIAGDKAAAVSAREAATEALYSAANGKTIKITPELDELLSRPAMQSAIGQAGTLAKNEGRGFSLRPATPPKPSAILDAAGNPMGMTPGQPGSMLTQDAHTIKRSLDDTIEGLAGQQGLAKNARRAAGDIRENFLGAIEAQVPEYGQARQTFAKMSAPVNQADVIESVLKRATESNVQGNMTPAAFNRAFNDRTAKSALGRKGATMANTLSPDQMSVMQNIRQDLQRLDFANNAGRGVGSDTVQKMAFNNMMAQSGMPSALQGFAPLGVVGNLAQKAGQVVYRDANERMAQQLAQALLDPNQAAGLLEAGMVTPQMQALIQNLRRGGAAAGASVPGMLQANQE